MPVMDPVKEGQEKLREAACIGDIIAVKDLLDKGIDVNSKHSMNGWTALHWSAKRGHANVVSCLLAHGADSSIKNNDGVVPAEVAQSDSLSALLGGGDASRDGKPHKQENLPITPNYLAHPPFPYMAGSSSFRPSVEQPSPTPSSERGKTPNPTSAVSTPRTNGPMLDANELVLKVRVANSPEQDFIELEIEKSRLSFEYVLSTICRELNVNPSLVHKLRKLPNTIVRKDKDVSRFVDFQEVELVLSNRADGYSPRHVDVVY